MRVLITLNHLGLGGTESYSVTVAEQLERLGHPTRLHAATATDRGRELAASRGLRLTVGDHALGRLDGVDALIAQDVGSAYLLAGRAGLRRIFVVHGLAAFEQPPAPPAGAAEVVVLNDRTGDHVEALSWRPATVRMRQPIDTERFRPLGANRRRARRLLLLSNALSGDRLRLLEDACADLGLELVRVGGSDRATTAPEQAIAAADIVVGYGRSILEAMAMGKAAYVWERAGGDGWVTPESYPAFESDGFSGAATDAVVDADRLRADLAAYTPDLGMSGQDLVRLHHRAIGHAEALVELLGAAEPGGVADGDGLEALALMVRANRRALDHVAGLEAESLRLRELLETEQLALHAERQALDAERQARLGAESRLATLLRSRSWRVTEPLRRLAARLRGARRTPAGPAS